MILFGMGLGVLYGYVLSDDKYTTKDRLIHVGFALLFMIYGLTTALAQLKEQLGLVD